MSIDSNDSNSIETHPFVMDHLPENYREKCAKELHETPTKKNEAITEIRNMIKDNKLLCDIEFGDDFLVQFLRNRKYDVSQALKHIINFVNYVNSYSFMFSGVSDIDKYYQYHPDGFFFTPLPRRCQDGCTVIYFEFGKWDPGVLPVEEFKSLATALFCQAIRDPMTQINGFKLIFDFTGTTFKQFKCFTPKNIYIFYRGVLDCLPGRQKQMIVVDSSFLAKIAYATFATFASNKVRERILMMESSTQLVDILPKSILPVHCGGLLNEHHMKNWWRQANAAQSEPTYTQTNYYN